MQKTRYEWFSIAILTVEIKYLSIFGFKKKERINALNPSNPISPDDIGFDKNEIQKIVEQYNLEQLQLQSNGASMND